jgi:hypothetical protein
VGSGPARTTWRGEKNSCNYGDLNSDNLKNYLQYRVCPKIHAGISEYYTRYSLNGIRYTGHTQKISTVSKVTKHLFLTLHGHSMHCQQRELFRYLMCCQQFASHAYCGAAGPVSKMASQQEKASVCSVLRCTDL